MLEFLYYNWPFFLMGLLVFNLVAVGVFAAVFYWSEKRNLIRDIHSLVESWKFSDSYEVQRVYQLSGWPETEPKSLYRRSLSDLKRIRDQVFHYQMSLIETPVMDVSEDLLRAISSVG